MLSNDENHPYAENYQSAVITPSIVHWEAETQELLRNFHRDGYVIISGLLSSSDACTLRSEIERKYNHPFSHLDDNSDQMRRNFALMRMFEFSYPFLQLLDYNPLLKLIELILGSDCHIISQTALRTPHGMGITRWHIDGDLYFDKRFLAATDALLPIPACFSLGVMIALSDFSNVIYGPTRLIPSSHRFGSTPEDDDSIIKEEMIKTFLANPGDALIINHQTWHSAHQNDSDHFRYLLVTSYGRRFIQQRFYPFLNYCLPKHVSENLNDKTKRLLGAHDKGPLG